jgi:hypothetical protein
VSDKPDASPTNHGLQPEVTDANLADLKNRNPATTDTTQALLKHYTDQFWSGISKTNTTLFAWAAALLLIIFTVLAPLSSKLNQANKKLERIQRLKEERNEKIAKRSKTSGGPDEAATARLRIAIEEYDKAIKEAKQKYHRDFISTVQEVPLPPPLNKLNIGIPYIPLAWTILFAGMVSFYLYRRTVALGTLAQIVHIHLIENRRRLRDIRGFGSWAPFWLAPLPKVKSNDSVTPAKMRWVNRALRQILGWNKGWTQRYGLMFLCFLLASILCVWIVWIAFTLDEILEESTHRLSIAVVIIVVGCILGSIFWLRPDIYFGGYPEQLTTPSKARRSFLWVVAASIATGLAYAVMPQEVLNYIRPPRVPRWHKKQAAKSAAIQVKPLAAEMQNKFLLNKKSRIAHYIGVDDRFFQRTKVKPEHLVSIDASKLSKELIFPLPPSRLNLQREAAADRTMAVPARNQDGNDTERVIIGEPMKTLNGAPVPAPVPVTAEEESPTPVGTASPTVEDNRSKPARNPQPAVVVLPPDESTAGPGAPSKPPKKIVRFPLKEAALSSERLAIQEVNKGDISKAIEVLWYGVRQDTWIKKKQARVLQRQAQLLLRAKAPDSSVKVNSETPLRNPYPSYRLYDLIAGLAKRLKNEEKWKAQLSLLRQYVKDNWNKDVVLNQRVNAWSNPSNKWKQKWEGKDLVWKHPPFENSKKPRAPKTK